MRRGNAKKLLHYVFDLDLPKVFSVTANVSLQYMSDKTDTDGNISKDESALNLQPNRHQFAALRR